MLLDIIDKTTRTYVEMIRTYDYVQYVDEFTGEGSFQINLPVSDVALPYLIRGNYIFFEEGIVGIIEGCKDSQDEDRQIVVTGKLTNHILVYRSILKTERYKGTFPSIAHKLVENHFVQPADSARKIDFVTLSSDVKYNPPGEVISFCDTGTTIRESISTMFLPYNYGFELYPVVKDYDEVQGITHNLEALEFRVLKPVDRTIDNPDGNTPVVFSFQLSNLSRLEYEEDGSAYCSVAIVASEGTGAERKVLEVGDKSKVGIDRIELYIDARDIQSEDEEGNKITEEELLALMQQRGLEKMEAHQVFTSFDGGVIVDGENRYTYGKDFYKGDYVSIIDDNYQRVFNLQITSVTKSISQGVEHFDLGFGLDQVTVGSLIDTSSGTSGGTGGSGGGEAGGTVSVEVESTETVTPGTPASVTNVGSDTDVKLRFAIPQGERGPKGDKGDPGQMGSSNLYAFVIKEDGHLYIEDGSPDAFYINVSGHLIYTTGGN